MLAFLAVALLAPTPSPEVPSAQLAAAEAPKAEADVLETAVPWWEKITVTVDPEGTQQSCRYETSAAGAKTCDKAISDSIRTGGKGRGLFSKLTFERRFSPGGRPDAGKMKPGDTLLGRQVMFLTFDAEGSINSCKVVAASGEARPDYDCDAVKKEQFRAHASEDPAERQAFMTIVAYGHTEAIA